MSATMQAILYGGTGQAKVLRPILQAAAIEVVLVVDDTPELASPFDDIEIVQGLDGLRGWLASRRSAAPLGFCVTIGNPFGRARLRIADALLALGMIELSAVHESAIIASSAQIGAGAQVMAGAIIQPHAVVGRQCIINTRASVDHDCVLGDACGVAPGATLCGSVHCGENVWIAAGATVGPRVTIGADAIVGAGAVVLSDVAASTTVVGVPARAIARHAKTSA